MAATQIKPKVTLDIEVTLKMTYEEACALNEMVKYGSKAFLEGYYKQLGKSYLQPYEKGVISLFETVRTTLPYQIHDLQEVIKKFNEIKAEKIVNK